MDGRKMKNRHPIKVAADHNFDSSDEEDLRNTVGNIPVKWYDEHEHIGYDWDGKKIEKSAEAMKDKGAIDRFLEQIEDVDYWRKVRDKQTGTDVCLSDDQLATLLNIRSGRYPTVGYNPYQPFIDFVTSQHEIHPISNRPADKRSFVPSADERRIVGRMLYAIKMGWARPPRIKPSDKPMYDMWSSEDASAENAKTKSQMARMKMHFPAPKLAPPTHAESYNPPPEYLLTDEEKAALKQLADDGDEDGDPKFIPEKYASLRQVPAYSRFVNERYERCLDLYLAPRQRKEKLNIDPDDLLPELPRPQDLQPYPCVLTLTYNGHSGHVRCLSIEPNVGQFMASGGDDGTVRLWEIANARCVRTLNLRSGIVSSLAWCPNAKVTIVAACAGSNLFLLNTASGDRLVVANTNTYLASISCEPDEGDAEQPIAVWRKADEIDGSAANSKHYQFTLSNELKQIVWHAKGDYFATLTTSKSADSVLLHQMSKHKSQAPFKKSKGLIQCVAFHRTSPILYVATQRWVKVYNLTKLQCTRKLQANCKWLSSMAIHPKGDNLITGGYDCSLNWFDLELSTKPYKNFKHHKAAIRSVCFHEHYPLFASSSDDGSTIIYHGRVYSDDLLKNAQIVPVKLLHGHAIIDGLSVMQSAFHPKQPWLISAGADSRLHLYTY